MNEEAALLAAIETCATGLRGGSDPLALLFCVKRAGGDDVQLAVGLGMLTAQGLIETLPGPEKRIKLTSAGFSRLEALVPLSVESGEDWLPGSWTSWQGNVPVSSDTPMEQLVGMMLEVFGTLSLAAGQPVSAGTLAKIWSLQGKRGGDLRLALDAMAANGDLMVSRGDRTFFALTTQGAAKAAGELDW